MDMNCHHCGSCIAEEAVFCPNCGIKLQSDPVQEEQPRYTAPEPVPVVEKPVKQADEPGKGFAIAGLVCGIVSIFYLRIITGALGLIFGLIARSRGYRKGMSTAAITCGAVGLGIGLLILSLVMTVGLLVGHVEPYAWDFIEEITSLIVSELL